MYSGLHVSCESHSSLHNRIESIHYKIPHLSDILKADIVRDSVYMFLQVTSEEATGAWEWDLHFRDGTNIGLQRYDELWYICIWRTMRSWAQEFISSGKGHGLQALTSQGPISKSSQQGGKLLLACWWILLVQKWAGPTPDKTCELHPSRITFVCSSNSGSANVMCGITEYALLVNWYYEENISV